MLRGAGPASNHIEKSAIAYTPGFGEQAGGTNRFYHGDWLGSTRYTSDSTGNNFPQALRFDAFGQRSKTLDAANWHPTDLQFAGSWGYQTEWASATEVGLGLQYLEQRYYDPAVGRFISPDPIGIAGGLNLYAYPSDPVGIVDPLGLDGNSVTPTVRSEISRIMANAVRDPIGARAELYELLATFQGGVPPAAAAVLIQNAVARTERIEAGITFLWRVGQNPFARRLAENLSRPIQASCDKLIDAFSRGNMNPGIGTRFMGNIWELRANDGARVILRRVAEKTFEVLGKFQGHVRGDAANSATIERIIEGR